MESFLRKLLYLGIVFFIFVPANAAFCSYATLNVAIDPPGGGTVTGGGINCPTDCAETFWVEFGPETVILTATPTNSCYRFSHWSGDLRG